MPTRQNLEFQSVLRSDFLDKILMVSGIDEGTYCLTVLIVYRTVIHTQCLDPSNVRGAIRSAKHVEIVSPIPAVDVALIVIFLYNERLQSVGDKIWLIHVFEVLRSCASGIDKNIVAEVPQLRQRTDIAIVKFNSSGLESLSHPG